MVALPAALGSLLSPGSRCLRLRPELRSARPISVSGACMIKPKEGKQADQTPIPEPAQGLSNPWAVLILPGWLRTRGPPVSVRLTASNCYMAALSLLSVDTRIMPISQRTTLRLGLMGAPQGRALTPRACLTADNPSAPAPSPRAAERPAKRRG